MNVLNSLIFHSSLRPAVMLMTNRSSRGTCLTYTNDFSIAEIPLLLSSSAVGLTTWNTDRNMYVGKEKRMLSFSASLSWNFF